MKKWSIICEHLGFENRLSEKSLIYIRNNKCPRIESWRASSTTVASVEFWPFGQLFSSTA